MSSTDLISRPVLAIERFRQEHGDVVSWSPVDWEVHQNLVEIALAHGPIGNLRARATRRTAAASIFAYAFVLYAVTEVASAIRGPQMTRLGFHLAYVVNGPARRADARLHYSGDLRFRQQILRVGIRVRGEVDRLSARLHRS
ncbi:hypothetical protein NX794_33230 [Streptomyces sp. LP11]|uniref:Uncharacterized protein n=1 Tax=Streptomyces pyxinicus TaxID=2970331 RepID=A0ABT2BBY7_9ACTN|nr:hypothetical protein [Streptomyces sp. LP11]MCS0606036.1 hypothetical protein [Streptomyces sp. LP11]